MSPTKAKKPSPAPASIEKKASSDKKQVADKKPGNDKLGARPSATSSKADNAPKPAAPKPAVAAPRSSSVPPPPAKPSPVHEVAPETGDAKDGKRDKAPSAVQTLAHELIASADAQSVLRHANALEDERETTANQSARLMQELAELKPDLLVPLIERFARLVASKNKRVVATCAAALAPLSRIAPAKVAKQLPLLTQNWELTTEEGKDGLVRTFAGLCTASVAYQKRLEPALARALGEAEPKLLIRWTEIVLPALKGEPHARARAVVEERLPQIPRPQAQKIADFLGIKLRPLPR
ncbi:MAG TPA: hypothetical protein VFZ61_06890 [Polyangiales bacterium]